MATPKIKGTYSLDVKTIRTLEKLASRWKMSKSAALRKAIEIAARGPEDPVAEKLAALDELRATFALTDEDVQRWVDDVRAERNAWRNPWKAVD